MINFLLISCTSWVTSNSDEHIAVLTKEKMEMAKKKKATKKKASKKKKTAKKKSKKK